MKPRLILVALGLVALSILSLGLQAQDTKSSLDKDKLFESEQQLLRQFAEFQEYLLKLQNRLARGDAEDKKRAAILAEVLTECKDLAINQDFVKMIEILRTLKDTTGDVEKALAQSDAITSKLRKLLDKLQTTTTNFSDERKQLKIFLDDLNKRITEQKIAEGLTKNQKTDKPELKDIQADVTKKTEKLADDIKKFLDKNGKGGEAQPTKGENKDGGKSEGAKGEAKDAGKQGEAKGTPKDAGPKDPKSGESPKGETKPGDKNAGQPSKNDDPKSASKGGEKGKEGPPQSGAKGDPKGDKGDKGEAKDNKGDKGDKAPGAPKDAGAKNDPMKDGPKGSAKGDPKSGDPKSSQGAPPPDSQAKAGGDPMGGAGGPPPMPSKEAKGSDKGGEGKGGDAKGGDGKQGEAKSGSAKSGEAKAGGASPDGGGGGSPPPSGAKGDGAPPPPPSGGKSPQNDDIAKSGKKIEEAGYDQKSAEDQIPKNTQAALKKQADAIAKMEEAKKKLEKLLQQLREEEIERVLAALQARCEKMLIMQTQVLVGTIDTDNEVQKNADKKANAENKKASQRLSDKEKDIVKEADKCIDILEAEGSAVAFPEVFQQIRADMMHVQKRLDLGDVHDVTQGIERDIIDTLKEMIAALKKAREDNQSDPGKPGKGGAGKPADPKLLELLQELKMVRSLQKRVNDRTDLYGKRYQGEQTSDPQIIRELRSLGDRQQRIQEIVRRIANGDNK